MSSESESVEKPGQIYAVDPVVTTDNPADFVGREPIRKRLKQELADKSGRFLIYGEPGQGKTTLAKMFAYENRSSFDLVVLQFSGDQDLDVTTAQLAEKLQLDIGELAPDVQRREIQKVLLGKRSLLILDDVRRTDLEALIPRSSGTSASTLLTSWEQSLSCVSPSASEELQGFGDVEIRRLFNKRTRKSNYADLIDRHWDTILNMANRLERSPLVMSIAVDYVLDSLSLDENHPGVDDVTIERLLADFEDVGAVFDLVIERCSAAELQMLKIIAVSSESGVWLDFVEDALKLETKESKELVRDLANRSLVRRLGNSQLQIHSLLRTHIHSRGDLSEIQRHHSETVRVWFSDYQTRWRDCEKILTEVIPTADRLRQDGDESWMTVTHVGFVLGYRIGQLAIGHEILKWQEAICIELGNKDGLQACYGNQALILKAWGKLQEAMDLHKKKEAICIELRNKDSLQRSYGNQALILQAWGKLQEAMDLHKKEEAICIELGNQSGLAYCHWSTVGLYGAKGDVQLQRQYLERALKIFENLKMPRETEAVEKEIAQLE